MNGDFSLLSGKHAPTPLEMAYIFLGKDHVIHPSMRPICGKQAMNHHIDQNEDQPSQSPAL